MTNPTIADTAQRLTGPTWTDDGVRYTVVFNRLSCAYMRKHRGRDCSGWQAVVLADGDMFMVLEFPDVLTDVCSTPTGALWALRSSLHGYMPNAPRCTRTN